MPLQLVEFEKTPTEEDKDHSTIHIKKENLDQVLALCGDRPLCIICICGPSRQGKSFILGHMIRCFDATEKDKDDWMDWSNPKKPLDKGFTWQNAYGPVTKGIWIWERPFILKSSQGKECAVLLIDTQGTYDEFTTNRDMTAIVGLSLLMSSVMIFNFFTNLQEDILSSLGTYIEYGLLALDDNDKDSEKPFQKLKFLIRDWNNPTEFPYGKKGGEEFIKKKLELKDNQPESAQKVRKTIEKCFQELACFLMPAIGDKALAKDYDGNIAALNRSFANKMEEFISGLVGGELEIKRIVGSEVTAKELRTYMDMYVDTFNSSTIPSAMSMWEATTLVANNNTVEKAQKIYQEEMKRQRRGKKYLNPEAFENARKGAEEAALGFFKDAKKYGDNVEGFRDSLVEFIGKEWTVNEADNQKRRMDHLKITEEDAKEAFKDGFVERFRFESDEEFWEEECIEKEGNRAKSMVLEEFRDALMAETEKDVEKKSEDLERLFDDLVNTVKIQNQLNQRKAEERIGVLVDEGLDKYKGEMKGILEDGKFENVDALQERSEQEMRDILEEFDGKRKPGEREFQDKFRGKLMEALEKEWGNVKTKFELNLMEMMEKANKAVQSLVNDYKKFLEQATKESMMTAETEEDLKTGHEEDLKEYQNKFEEECLFGESSRQRAKLIEKLKDEMDNALEQALMKVVEYKRKKDEECKENVRKAGEWYRKEMRDILENNEYLLEEELSREHDRVKGEAIAKLKDDCVEGVEMKEDFLGDLDENIENMFDEFKRANKKQGEISFSQTKAKVQESLEKYKQVMTKVVEELKFVGGSAAGNIDEDHERARKEAEESILGKCGKLDDEKKDEILETLRCHIEKAFEEQKKAVKLKELEMKSAVRDVLDKARKYYHGEMQKNIDKKDYMEPDKLVQLHGKLLGLAVSQYGGDLEEGHKSQLKVGLDQSFLKYKEENDMKFNSEAKEIAIGIDLGTTYCCVAAYYKGEVKVVLNSIGKNLTPSYIAFGEDGASETIGELAKIASFKDPENTIYDAKRMIGRKWEDEKLQNDMKFWPFTVINDGGVPKIQARGKTFYPEQISAKLLKSLKNEAEKQLQKEIKKVVITVPAYFTDGQRQATVDAGEIAGFEVLEILNEPTAAAIAYKIQKINDDARKVLIYDLGGGTFDVAVLEMEHNEIKVLAVDGDTHLGGEDFDKSMMEYCAQQFKKGKGVDLFEGKDDTNKVVRDKARQAIRRLHIYSEDRKKDLASNSKTKVEIDNLKNGKDICVEVTRDKFEEINHGFFEKTLQIVDKALTSAKLDKRDIDDIVLVGGSTRIPKVQAMLKRHFGGKALNHAIHPDEAVAYGAAVRAAMLNGAEASSSVDFGSTRIQDVTPMSLGIELYRGVFSVIVKKGSKVPSTHQQENYTTLHDNQTSVDIVIFQGEDPVAKNNELLGNFRLSGIPSAPRGVEKIRVQMEIDRLGILKVTATSKGSGSEERLVIKADKSRLSDEEKRRLMDEESASRSASTESRRSSHNDSDEKEDDEDVTDKDEDDDDYGSWKY